MGTDSKFWKLFTQISSFIIFMGFIKIVVFYKAFGIPAQYFTNVSELGILVSDNLIYITLLLAIAIIGAELKLYYESINKEDDFQNNEIDEIAMKSIEEKKKIKNNLSKKRRKYIIIACIILPLLILVYSIFKNSFEYYVLFFSVFIACITVIFLLCFTDFSYKHIGSTESLKITMLFPFTLALMGTITVNEIKQIKKGKYKGTIINLNDSTNIITSDSVVFVGKTENYVFFYNLNSKTSEIYPTSEVKKIILKQN